ncbi:hypothetical protein BGZ47_000079 [Haplosporangium gracile]|nr:hypothetical protein BGZ47_000079 [Haplosporangium gracile]
MKYTKQLRHRINRFVTVKDALSCVFVSKAWSTTFIPVVWFKIDFDTQPRFPDLPSDSVAKHGHLIRVVKGAISSSQVSTLANAGVSKLKELEIDILWNLPSKTCSPTRTSPGITPVCKATVPMAKIKTVAVFDNSKDFDFEEVRVAPVLDEFQGASNQILHLIPRGRPQLEELDLCAHEMDMDAIESGEEIKELDAKDKILKAIALWRKGCWRRWQEKAESSIAPMDEQGQIDLSLEARVARHLLKFDKLW